MPTGGILGDGVKLAYATGSPQSWNQLIQLKDLPKPPGRVPDRLESTTHGSAGDHTYYLGLNEIPDIEAVLMFDPANAGHLAMITARDAKTLLYFRVEVPTNVAKTTFMAWEFQAYVAKADVNTPITELQTLDLGLMYAGSYWFNPNGVATEIS